jgi:hypothetical protein
VIDTQLSLNNHFGASQTWTHESFGMALLLQISSINRLGNLARLEYSEGKGQHVRLGVLASDFDIEGSSPTELATGLLLDSYRVQHIRAALKSGERNITDSFRRRSNIFLLLLFIRSYRKCNYRWDIDILGRNSIPTCLVGADLTKVTSQLWGFLVCKWGNRFCKRLPV